MRNSLRAGASAQDVLAKAASGPEGRRPRSNRAPASRAIGAGGGGDGDGADIADRFGIDAAEPGGALAGGPRLQSAQRADLRHFSSAIGGTEGGCGYSRDVARDCPGGRVAAWRQGRLA